MVKLFEEYDGIDYTDLNQQNLLDLVELVNNEYNVFEYLLDINIGVDNILRLYHEEYNFLEEIKKENVKIQLKKYLKEVDLDELVNIFNNEVNLWVCIFDDKENLVENLGIEEFINEYRIRVKKDKNDDSYESNDSFDSFDTYNNMCRDYVVDGCPDEILNQGSESDYSASYSDNSY